MNCNYNYRKQYFGLILFLSLVTFSFGQNLTSDKSDYYPGELATFSGSGFVPNELVDLVVLHHDETPNDGENHEHWEVQADSIGTFVTTWIVCTDDCLGSTLRAIANGNLGSYAEAIFTDSPRIGSITIAPSSQTICIPLIGNSTTTSTTTAVRAQNGTVNGTYSITGLPTGVTGAFAPTSFTSNGGNNFPSSTLTLTISNTALAGTYTFTVKCADNADSATTTGTLILNQLPSISCPATILANTDSNSCKKSVTFAATATGATQPLTYKIGTTTISSPHDFPVGPTTVTATATNSCGSSSCTFIVTISDTTPPVINSTGNNATINCPSQSQFNTPTATDNCDQSPQIIEVSDITTPGNCVNTYIRVKTWKAVDVSGNQSQTISQTITVIDNTPPVFAALPAESTIDCPALPQFAQASASDLCDLNVALTFEDVTSAGNCPGNYKVTRTWTATDDCGNTATASQVINVQDITAPAFAALPADSTIDCPATPQFAQASASDLCDLNVTLTFDDVTSAGNCPGNYKVTRTWTATDDCGNSSTASQVINVQDITAPAFAALPADSTIDCPETPQFAQASASDLCDLNVALTFEDVTSAGNCPGNYKVTRTWTATDDCGNTATASQVINVQDITAPAFAALPADSTIDCPATPQFAQASASDLCDLNVTLTFDDVTSAGNCPGNYKVTRTWTATDDCGNSSTASQVINVQDVTAPAFAALPADSTIDCPATPQFAQASASDLCDLNVTLTFDDETTAGNCPGNYKVTRTWTATDDCGNTATASQVINVQDVTAPVFAALPADSTIDCPATPQFAQASASDLCDLNVTLTFDDVTSAGNCPGNYKVTRTWTATDDCGNSSTASQVINVQDVTAPVFAVLPADSTIDCPATPQFAQASASDLCDLNVTLTFDDVTSAGNCLGNYKVTRTWTATDDCGNSSTASQVINVQDVTAPVFAALPADSTIDCPATPQFAQASASDLCDLNVTLTFDDVTSAGNCPGNYKVTRTWTATDDCGNSATASQVINVQDVTAPLAICKNVTIQLNSYGNATLTASEVNNGSNDTCSSVSLSLSKTSFNCNDVGSNNVVLTVTDVCGNSSSCTAIVTVEDKIAPVAICKPVSVFLDSSGSVTITPTQINNGSSDACGGLTFALSQSTFNSAGTYSVTLTVTDANNNSSTCTTSVTVNKRPTSLVYDVTLPDVGDQSKQYSDQANLRATLLDITNGLPGVPISGKTICFTIGSQSVSDTFGGTGNGTNANGAAEANLILTQAPGNYSVASSFAGDNTYSQSSDSDPFTILCEDALVYYTGSSYVSTSSATSSNATVTLSATIKDISAEPNSDINFGNITNAKVDFINRENGSVIAQNIPIGLVSVGDTKVGTATYNWSTTISGDSQSFTIGIIVKGYYCKDNSIDNEVVTISKPLGDLFITGGGYLVLTNSGGIKSGTTGTKNNYGFNVKYNKNKTNLQGNINTIIRKLESDGIIHVYQIKGNSMTSLSVITTCPKKSTFVGKANIQDITNPLNVIAVDGNATLQVTMTDNGEPGNYDKIGITVWNKLGGLWYSSNWNGTTTIEQTIAGGNLKVHGGSECGNTPIVKYNDNLNEKNIVLEKPEFKIWPNPSVQDFNLEITNRVKNQPTLIEVFDQSGRLIQTLKTDDNQFQFGANLQSGHYFIQISNGEFKDSKQIIKY